MSHVHEVLGFKDTRLPEGGLVQSSGARQHPGMKEFDPLAIACVCYLTGIAAVSGKEIEISGQIEVNGPLVPLHVVRRPPVSLEIVSGQEKILALG